MAYHYDSSKWSRLPKTLFLLCLAALVSFHLLFATNCLAKEKETIVIATASTTGTYYPMGGGMANLAPKKIDSIKRATAQVTAGSAENCALIGSNEVDFAIANANVVMEAYEGSKRFGKGKKNIRSLFWMHMTHQHLIVAEDSSYQSLEDLKGKRLAVGAPGSGLAFNVMALLDAYGLSFDDFDTKYISGTPAVNAFKDGRIDALFLAAGIPTGSVASLAMARDIRLLDFPKEIIAKVQKKFPAYTETRIPADTYKGIDEGVTVLAPRNVFICPESLSEDVVYDFIKMVHDNLDWFAENIHRGFELYDFDPSVKNIAPLHPGAIKYYQEKGLMD